MKRARSKRHILRKMHGIGRRYGSEPTDARCEQLARLAGSYTRQYWHLVPRIGRLAQDTTARKIAAR